MGATHTQHTTSMSQWKRGNAEAVVAAATAARTRVLLTGHACGSSKQATTKTDKKNGSFETKKKSATKSIEFCIENIGASENVDVDKVNGDPVMIAQHVYQFGSTKGRTSTQKRPPSFRHRFSICDPTVCEPLLCVCWRCLFSVASQSEHAVRRGCFLRFSGYLLLRYGREHNNL